MVIIMTQDCYNGVVLYFETADGLSTNNQVVPIVGVRKEDLERRGIKIHSTYSFNDILENYKHLSEDGVNAIHESCPENYVKSIETRNQKIIASMHNELKTAGNGSYLLMDILEGSVIENMKKILNPSVYDKVSFVKDE